MFNEPHDLLHEFPEFQEQIQSLKNNDSYFAELFQRYHELDEEIHRIMVGVETPSDFYIETLKKSRLFLKDRVYALLQEGG
jgi:hypothetical protein